MLLLPIIIWKEHFDMWWTQICTTKYIIIQVPITVPNDFNVDATLNLHKEKRKSYQVKSLVLQDSNKSSVKC